MEVILAIDAGTTGVRALAVSPSGDVLDVAYRELSQSFPAPGWVEHDAEEIWRLVVETADEVASRQRAICAVGITNQRETVVGFDRETGSVAGPAPVWQDKRTAARCAELRAGASGDLVRDRTGLVLDPYFSATKMAWLLESGRLDDARSPALATVDAWLLWQLTGGVDAGCYATEHSNASRTLLYDLDARANTTELAQLFGIPLEVLPEVRASCGRFAEVSTPALPALAGVPVSGILGDQQAALFGQRCVEPGMAKVTYGTGAFVLSNAGPTRPAAQEGLLTTVAWDLGEHGGLSYALEGSAFIAGAAIGWLRDELGLFADAADLEPLARSVQSADGLRFIPAFVGLGSPWWDDSARGVLAGITRGSTSAHLARAVIDSLAFEVRAITDAMGTANPIISLRADGGAAVMNLLLERQAAQSDVSVARPRSLESTAIGVALLAGLAEGVVGSLDELSSSWQPAETFEPNAARAEQDADYASWIEMLERSRGLG